MAWRYCAMRGESLEPGGCSAWPTSAWAIATMRAAGELPAGAATGPTVPVAVVALVPAAPAPSGVSVPAAVPVVEPVTEALRSIVANASVDDVAAVVAAVAVCAGAEPRRRAGSSARRCG